MLEKLLSQVLFLEKLPSQLLLLEKLLSQKCYFAQYSFFLKIFSLLLYKLKKIIKLVKGERKKVEIVESSTLSNSPLTFSKLKNRNRRFYNTKI